MVRILSNLFNLYRYDWKPQNVPIVYNLFPTSLFNLVEISNNPSTICVQRGPE